MAKLFVKNGTDNDSLNTLVFCSRWVYILRFLAYRKDYDTLLHTKKNYWNINCDQIIIKSNKTSVKVTEDELFKIIDLIAV